MNVLVVEDNEDNMALVVKILRHAGHAVSGARSGTLALEQLAATSPDVILMDLGLPGLDGWETTRRIRKMERLQFVPIVALTAHALKAEDRERAVEAGCTGYVTKPFDKNHLLATLEAYNPDKAPARRPPGSGEDRGG